MKLVASKDNSKEKVNLQISPPPQKKTTSKQNFLLFYSSINCYHNYNHNHHHHHCGTTHGNHTSMWFRDVFMLDDSVQWSLHSNCTWSCSFYWLTWLYLMKIKTVHVYDSEILLSLNSLCKYEVLAYVIFMI